jgi:hypothetical protein
LCFVVRKIKIWSWVGFWHHGIHIHFHKVPSEMVHCICTCMHALTHACARAHTHTHTNTHAHKSMMYVYSNLYLFLVC